MRFVRPLMGLLLAVLGAGYVTYRLKDPERRAMDDAARQSAPGRFVRLADGMTHYEIAGPPGGPLVVMASAFSVPGYMWDPLFSQLADSGFRVLRYDYYGRGWSDRPDVAYDMDLFVRQLAGLLDSLGVSEAFSLASISYGAAITTAFADRYPGRVGALIYIGPVFNNRRPLPPRERTALAWNIDMVLKGGADAMARGQVEDFLHPEQHPDWPGLYRVQQQFKGTRESLRRTRVAISQAPDQQAQLRAVGGHPRPVLLVWGRMDPAAPFEESAAVQAALPSARLVPVDSAALLPHVERPDVVLPAIIGFLRQVGPRAPAS